MTRQDIISRIDKLKFALRELTDSQIDFIEYVVNQFRTPFIKLEQHPDFDLVNNSFLNDFGDVLRIHHCFSRQALSRDRFEYALEKTLTLKHMQNYERIFTLRCLAKSPEKWWYELVEIPKSLLEKANSGKFEIKRNTSQTTLPGYCRVKDNEDNLEFELYFDAGSERKLQIRHLRKDLCILHATWIFSTDSEGATKKTLVEFD